MNTTPCTLAALMRLRAQFRCLKRVAIAQGVIIAALLIWSFRTWLW